MSNKSKVKKKTSAIAIDKKGLIGQITCGCILQCISSTAAPVILSEKEKVYKIKKKKKKKKREKEKKYYRF